MYFLNLGVKGLNAAPFSIGQLTFFCQTLISFNSCGGVGGATTSCLARLAILDQKLKDEIKQEICQVLQSSNYELNEESLGKMEHLQRFIYEVKVAVRRGGREGGGRGVGGGRGGGGEWGKGSGGGRGEEGSGGRGVGGGRGEEGSGGRGEWGEGGGRGWGPGGGTILCATYSTNDQDLHEIDLLFRALDFRFYACILQSPYSSPEQGKLQLNSICPMHFRRQWHLQSIEDS